MILHNENNINSENNDNGSINKASLHRVTSFSSRSQILVENVEPIQYQVDYDDDDDDEFDGEDGDVVEDD
eukprot:Pgem_evm1s13029